MGLESPVNTIQDLNSANPLGTDLRSQGDDHLRLIKAALKDTWLTGVIGSRPSAGTAHRWYFATDTDQLFYDNGTSWLELAQSTFSTVGLFSARPSAGNAGYLYYATDTDQFFVDDGSAWQEVGNQTRVNKIYVDGDGAVGGTAGKTLVDADHSGYDTVIVGCDISTASIVLTMDSLADSNGVEFIVHVTDDDNSEVRRLQVKTDGGTEMGTYYRKGDGASFLPTASAWDIFNETVTAITILELGADQSCTGSAYTRIWNATYTQHRDTGNCWNTATDIWTAPFDCYVDIKMHYRVLSATLEPVVRIDNVANTLSDSNDPVDGAGGVTAELASGETLYFYIYNRGATTTIEGDSSWASSLHIRIIGRKR